MYETEKWLVHEYSDFEEDIRILEEILRLIINPTGNERRLEALTKGNTQLILPFMNRRIDGVYPIPAGGNVVGTVLHYRLKLPLLLAPTGNSLVCDEIVDTGDTMSHYIKKGNLCLSLFYNPESLYEPHIWRHKKLRKWVHFFWEAPEDGDDRN